MKKLLLLIFMFFISLSANATMMQGGIYTNDYNSTQQNRVLDKTTKKPIPNAKITIPSKKFITYTNQNGEFQIKNIDKTMILSVEKENYRPFSITISKGTTPRTFYIEKSNTFDIQLEENLCHIGDNNFSTASANALQFKSRAIGPTYKKKFYFSNKTMNKQNYIVFGSITGIDTALARGMGQNHIVNSFASPPSVYINGHKIAEIKINGDNQKIKIPAQFIKWNQYNEIMIKAGQNLMQTAYIDYDDIEFMNLSIQVF